ILRDLGLFELFAEKALKREQLRETVDIPALVEHLSDSLRRELDFREEAANVERMREALVPYDRLDVPRLYPELSTSRLLLLDFMRDDPKFLAEAVLLLAGEESRDELDLESMERDFADFIERFRIGSLRDIEIGPMLDGILQIASRHGIRLPASLALSGKAFGQMQLAVTKLDPTLDPFRVIGRFLLRNVGQRLRRQADPQQLYYEAEKIKLRVVRFVEAVERATGARPGQKLQVDFLGAASIEDAIRGAGRRLAMSAGAASGLVGAAATAAAGTAGWIPITFAGVAGVFGSWLALDLLGRR